MVFYVIAVAFILAVAGVCMAFSSDTDDKNLAFLAEFGWECEKGCIEYEKIIIPSVFDDIYTGYNELQKTAGLDLSPYAGKRAVRYTYLVSNFPSPPENQIIRANVLTVGGEPVGGDIMSVNSNGFMVSLAYLSEGK